MTQVVPAQGHPEQLTAWAIKAMREYRGLTREEFAERLSAATGDAWNYNLVAKLERGDKTIRGDTLTLIAAILDTPVTWFHYGPITYYEAAGQLPSQINPQARRAALGDIGHLPGRPVLPFNDGLTGK